MQLAIFSDIHANLPALEAVLKDIETHQPDLICCLGDLVDQNIWNKEVIQMIRAHNIPCIMGNHDQGIGNGQNSFRFSFSTQEQLAWGKEAIAFTHSQLNQKDKKFLRSLPRHLRFDFESANGAFNILMVHGSPKDINEYVLHDTPEDGLRTMLEEAGTQILVMGHTHHPYHQIITTRNQEKKTFSHAINVGSVGCPKDGNWQACYALIEWEDDACMLMDPKALKVSLQRVPYDIDRVVHAIQKSSLPVYYADRLIKN